MLGCFFIVVNSSVSTISRNIRLFLLRIKNTIYSRRKYWNTLLIPSIFDFPLRFGHKSTFERKFVFITFSYYRINKARDTK